MWAKAHVSVQLDDARSTCHVYDDGAPILDVSTGSAFLALTVPDRDAVTDADVAAARDLLAAVREYVAEVERVRIEQRARADAGAVA